MVNAFIESIMVPVIDMIEFYTLSTEALQNFPFLDPIWTYMRVVGLAVLLLICIGQLLISNFGALGFDGEDPWSIIGRTLCMVVLVMLSKDILMQAVEIVVRSQQVVANAVFADGYGMGSVLLNLVKAIIQGTMVPFMFIPIGYIVYKCIRLAFKVFERQVLCALLIISSPLAFAAGGSRATVGYLTGFMRLFIGNLLTQFLQMVILTALNVMMVRANNGLMFSTFYEFAVVVVILNLAEKLEDIVRDASVSVGVGRTTSNLMGATQQIIGTATTVVKALV